MLDSFLLGNRHAATATLRYPAFTESGASLIGLCHGNLACRNAARTPMQLSDTRNHNAT